MVKHQEVSKYYQIDCGHQTQRADIYPKNFILADLARALCVVQDQQLFLICHVYSKVSRPIWIDYDQPMLSPEVIRNNGIRCISIRK